MVDAERVATEASRVARQARRLTQLAAQLRDQPVLATVIVQPGQALEEVLGPLRIALAGARGTVVITAQHDLRGDKCQTDSANAAAANGHGSPRTREGQSAK